MADITVKFADGKEHIYTNVPDTVTPDQIEQRAMQDFQGAKVSHLARVAATAAESPKRESAQTEQPSFLQNLKRQAELTARAGIQGVGDVVGIVQNPLNVLTRGIMPTSSETYGGLANRLGLAQPETPTEKIVNAASRGVVGAGGTVGAGTALSRATPVLVSKFGEAIATQPVAQITSGALGGGSAEIAKQAGVGEKGQLAAGIAGAFAPSGVALIAPKFGGVLANVIGGAGTHTGGETLKQAAKSGLAGGKSQESFIENMRGNAPIQGVLEDVKSNLAEMGRQRGEMYRNGMAQISGDKTVLDFNGIDNSLANEMKAITFKGVSKNDAAAKKLTEVSDIIGDWKTFNPVEYHTPEGLDALKQRVGAVLESIDPVKDKTSYKVVGSVYNSIKNEISKQAPVYSKVMKDYTDATEHITEIERALSTGKKASADTTMRKLQSLMRNNANTNYGNRLALAQQLEQQGGTEIMPALAGQALNTWTPRGLGSATMGLSGLGGYSVGGPALAVPMLAAQSPRLMGEAALKAGQGARLLNQAAGGIVNRNALSALLQSGQYGAMGKNQ